LQVAPAAVVVVLAQLVLMEVIQTEVLAVLVPSGLLLVAITTQEAAAADHTTE
jgi:hypothetical protein